MKMDSKKATIHKEALERLNLGMDVEAENNKDAYDDLRNIIGKQWPDDIREERDADNRPCLTVNRLPQFVRQVTGDIRSMNPSITVLPGDEQATSETATLIEGLVRQIQYASDASSVFESAGESAASCGKGALRVLSQYCDEMSFDQEIALRSIRDPFAVVWDPKAVMPTREDAEWVFIKERVQIAAFEEEYPDATPAPVRDDGTTLNWRTGNELVIAEYFWKDFVEKTIWQMPDGSVSETKPPFDAPSRKTITHKIMWVKMTGNEILEGPKEFPSKFIPVIAVVGEEINIGGSVYRSSVIRFAKDSQRMYNYWRSAQTEMVALQPKAPYLVTAKQIAKQETSWSDANEKNLPYLIYTPDEKAPGAPQRQAPPMPSTGMMQEVGLAAEDMKATTGIYDAGLGNRSNEHSGVAIRQRQMESDVATSIYSDNVGKAVAYCGRIIVDMIPRIYDTQRVLQIVGKDETHDRVIVNQVQATIDGQTTANDLSVGKYDVRVTVGPNYTTMRQQTAESMIDFIKAMPQAGMVTADLIAKYQDWPHADLFAERLQKALPPGLVDNGGGDPQQQAMAQQQAAQQQQAQQQQQGMAQAMAELQLREQQAKVGQAEANAAKAEAEAHKASLELRGFAPAVPVHTGLGQFAG